MEKPKPKKKMKTTVYILEEKERLLDEVFISRIRKCNKTNRSQLICEAIRLLCEKEMKAVVSK